jgi:hypothetical protein
MSHLGDSHRGSISLFLQSDKATTSISDSHKLFILDEIIETDPHINLLIGLTSFEMPYSFYNVNQFNNTFEISANGNTVNFNISSQNYTATQLATELTSQLAVSSRVTLLGQTITCTFDDQSTKFLFNSTATAIPYTITSNTTMNKILGLELPSTSGVGFLFSNNIINLSGSPSIYFRLNNIGIRNRDSRGKTDGTIQKINVNCNFGEFIFYESLENIYYPLSNRTITQLDITLTDSDNNELFLNGAEFSCTLTIHFQKIRENVIPQKYLLDMISRLENNQNDESENKK